MFKVILFVFYCIISTELYALNINDTITEWYIESHEKTDRFMLFCRGWKYHPPPQKIIK